MIPSLFSVPTWLKNVYSGVKEKRKRTESFQSLCLLWFCIFCELDLLWACAFCYPVSVLSIWSCIFFNSVSLLSLYLLWPSFFYCDSVTFEIMCLLWFCIFVGHVSFVIQCLLLRSCIFCVPVPFVILYLCWSCAFCVTVPFAILAFCDTVPFVILAFCDTMPFVTLYLLLYCACDPVSLKIQWFLWSCNFVDLMPFSILFFV